jgi:hypothetical protein
MEQGTSIFIFNFFLFLLPSHLEDSPEKKKKSRKKKKIPLPPVSTLPIVKRWD